MKIGDKFAHKEDGQIYTVIEKPTNKAWVRLEYTSGTQTRRFVCSTKDIRRYLRKLNKLERILT